MYALVNNSIHASRYWHSRNTEIPQAFFSWFKNKLILAEKNLNQPTDLVPNSPPKI
jgi:hypothetical protein